MKNKFYLILITLTLLLLGCGESSNESDSHLLLKEENTLNSKLVPVTKNNTSISQKNIPLKKESARQEATPTNYYYEFKDLKNQANILDIQNDKYNFKNIKQPIIIITIMATWCPPCRGQIPHLSKLQQKFKKHIFVMSTLVHDDISKEKLEKFIISQKMRFYLSVDQKENLKFIEMITPKLGLNKDFPMPLTIVFVRGKYFTHYEGMIPEEMIESDINQLLEKIKKR